MWYCPKKNSVLYEENSEDYTASFFSDNATILVGLSNFMEFMTTKWKKNHDVH